ncbi:hypothetical protein CRUP_025044, partial [Coryphaenoides rupestris]
MWVKPSPSSEEQHEEEALHSWGGLSTDTFSFLEGDSSSSLPEIVVHGNAFSRAIVPHSAGPFVFPDEYKLTEEQALSVSDHYPVQLAHEAHLDLLEGLQLRYGNEDDDGLSAAADIDLLR